MTAGPKSKALLQGGGLEELQVIIRPPPEETPEALEAPKVKYRHHLPGYQSLRVQGSCITSTVCAWVVSAAFCMPDAEEHRQLHIERCNLSVS